MVNNFFGKAKLDRRNEDQCRTDILRVCKRPMFAAKAKYKKPVGGKDIIGLSIRMAEEMARLWGNIHTSKRCIYDDPEKRIIAVSVVDLERNVSYVSEIPIIKTVERKSAKGRTVVSERINSYGEKVSVVVATDDEVYVKENAMTSKELRNSILRCIPEWMKDEAIQAVDQTERSRIKDDPDSVKHELFDKFVRLGVQPTNLADYLGHPLENISPNEIMELSEIANAIDDGHATWQEYVAARQDDREAAKQQADKPKATTLEMPEGFSAGSREHTPVEKPMAPEESQAQKPKEEISEWDDPSYVEAVIHENVARLRRSAAGGRLLAQVFHDFKVVDELHVPKESAKLFAKRVEQEVKTLLGG